MGKRSEFIIIIIYHVSTYNSKHCRCVCNCYYYDRAVHISVALDMRTLLDRENISSRTNGQVAGSVSGKTTGGGGGYTGIATNRGIKYHG